MEAGVRILLPSESFHLQLWSKPHCAKPQVPSMLIVDEELEGFFVESEDDEPTSRRLSLAGSRTELWRDDEDDGLSQCPTSEVRYG